MMEILFIDTQKRGADTDKNTDQTVAWKVAKSNIYIEMSNFE